MSMEGMRLTEAAQAERDDFERYSREYGGCSCFLGSAPCGHCTHPGNPQNQEDDDCWEPDEEESPVSVTRYEPEEVNHRDRYETATMYEKADGGYVEFDDYEALRRERDAMAIYRDQGWKQAEKLEQERDRLAERCRELEDRNERIRDHSKYVAEGTNKIGAALRAVKEALGLPVDASVLDDLTPAIDTLRAENERLRMQLVACGVVALANTLESAEKARDMHPDYMSASCRDVIRAVDREIALRAEVERLQGLLKEARYPVAHYLSDREEASDRAPTKSMRYEAGQSMLKVRRLLINIDAALEASR